MTRLEAHGRLALMEDRTFLAEGPFLGDYFPSIATALAEASGRLTECTTDDELREAASHGEILARSGIFSTDAIADTAEAVIREVMAWGEQQEAQFRDPITGANHS